MDRILGEKTYGKLTQSFGTVITRLVEPRKDAFTKLSYLEYTNLTTAHVLTVMRPLGKTTLTADAAASQAVINITANPGSYSTLMNPVPRTANNLLAASDFVVLQLADGTYVLDTVSSISTLAVTLATSLPTLGAKAGAILWHFGVIADVNPFDAIAHPQFTLPVSSTTVYGTRPGDSLAGWIGSYGTNEPLICHSGNATAAGIMERVQAIYTQIGGQK